jgi:hypothetical protein
VTAVAADAIDLPEYFAYLKAHLDVEDERSILATAPMLLALARNQRFLPRYLTEALANPARFQEGNGYAGPVVILGGGDGYMVRAIGWPAADDERRTPSNLGVHAYDGVAQVAHNHNFSILSTCYSGPGYETDLYEWEPIGDREPEPGDKVVMRYRGRQRLEPGQTIFYRAFKDAHVQYEAAAYSVTLNLLVHPAVEDLGDQYYFDVKNHEIVLPGGLGNDRRVQLIQLAASLGDPAFAAPLAVIADAHPSARVRTAARQAVDSVFGRSTA